MPRHTTTIDDSTTARRAAPEPAIAYARGLSKTYGSGDTEVRALDGIDVDFVRGEPTAIMGPSGSGKPVLAAVFGTMIGVAVGVGIAAVMPTVFGDIGLSVLAGPWLQLAGMLVVAAVLGVVAALWPAIHAARLPVLDAVASY